MSPSTRQTTRQTPPPINKRPVKRYKPRMPRMDKEQRQNARFLEQATLAWRESEYAAQHPEAVRPYRPRHKTHHLLPNKHTPGVASCTIGRCTYAVWLTLDGQGIKGRLGDGELEPAQLIVPLGLFAEQTIEPGRRLTWNEQPQ